MGCAVAALLLSSLTACGGPAPASAAAPTIAAPSPAAQGPASLDTRACAGVQGVMGHMTASTVHWVPQRDPFDKVVAAQIRLLALDLARQGPQARTQHTREVVAANAKAFTAVADAMGEGNRKKVTSAIAGTRVAYRALKGVCAGLR